MTMTACVHVAGTKMMCTASMLVRVRCTSGSPQVCVPFAMFNSTARAASFKTTCAASAGSNVGALSENQSQSQCQSQRSQNQCQSQIQSQGWSLHELNEQEPEQEPVRVKVPGNPTTKHQQASPAEEATAGKTNQAARTQSVGIGTEVDGHMQASEIDCA